MCGKSAANIILNGEALKVISLVLVRGQLSSLTPLLVSIVLGLLATAAREEKEIRKERNDPYLQMI